MRRDLAGRVILLTGASRGIGRCVALRLAAEKAKLVLASRSREPLNELTTELQRTGVEAVPVAVDLTDPAGRAELADTVRQRFGHLDILINNAGLASFGEFSTSSEAILRRIMEINFFTPVELTRECLPLLQNAYRRDSSVRPALVNVASIVGRRGIPSFPEHSASKHAIVGMTEALRAEFVRFDVDVMLVIPGLVRADDLNAHLLRNEGRVGIDYQTAQSADAVARGMVRGIKRGSRETVIGWTARWVWRGEQFFPRLMDWILARKVRKFEERARAEHSQQRGV